MRDIVELLYKFTDEICRKENYTEDELWDYLVHRGCGILNCHAATMFGADENRKTLTFLKTAGPVGADLIGVTFPYSGVVGACVTDRKPLIVNDAENSPFFSNKVDKSSGFRTKSVIAVPAVFNGQLLGVMEFINSAEGSFSLDDMQAACVMTSYIAACVVHSRKVVSKLI